MSSFQLIKQGIPTVGFIVLGAYSLSVFVEGKNKAVDLSRGKSRSEREAEVERYESSKGGFGPAFGFFLVYIGANVNKFNLPPITQSRSSRSSRVHGPPDRSSRVLQRTTARIVLHSLAKESTRSLALPLLLLRPWLSSHHVQSSPLQRQSLRLVHRVCLVLQILRKRLPGGFSHLIWVEERGERREERGERRD